MVGIRYQRPAIRDYGDLGELTASLHPVHHTTGFAFAPSTPAGGGGGGGAGGVGGVNATAPGVSHATVPGDTVNVLSGPTSGSPGAGAGAPGTSGGGPGDVGGAVATGGSEALPFTGFPVAVAAAFGAALAAGGAFLRRTLSRE